MNKDKEYFLTIDCGTQSIRGLVFDDKGGQILKLKQEIEPYFSEQPGWAEQDPDLYYNVMCQICKEIRDEHSEIYNQIIGVTVTTMRDCCVCVDENGMPLRPVILWMDQREIEKMKPMKLPQKTVMMAIGMESAARKVNMNCKAHWIQDNEPEIWAKTHKFLMLSSYLNLKMTGKYVDSVANQIGHIPLNYKKFKWDSPMGIKRQIMQVEREKLVDLVQPGTVIGHVTPELAEETGLKVGIPIVTTGSDKGCETLGVGCVDNSSVSISLGSHATIQTTTDKYYEVNRYIPPFPAVKPQCYNPELQIFRGYWMISWFKKEFARKEFEEGKKSGRSPEEILNERIREIPPGCEGLILQPYWGAPIKAPEAKGAIIGFSDCHTRIHIYRSIIEGIGYGLYEGMKSIEKKSGETVKRVYISGGGSQSDAICQITADIFNKPVFRVQTYETSGLGAAITGFIGLGKFKSYDEAVENMVHIGSRFKPNKKDVLTYQEIYNKVYKKIYRRLRPLYTELKEIYQSKGRV